MDNLAAVASSAIYSSIGLWKQVFAAGSVISTHYQLRPDFAPEIQTSDSIWDQVRSVSLTSNILWLYPSQSKTFVPTNDVTASN